MAKDTLVNSDPQAPANDGQEHHLRDAGRSILALSLREIATTHGRTSIGFLWMFLEPIAGIALLTIIFSFFMRVPAIGQSFALFYASGILPFSLYMGMSGKVASALRFSRPLLAYPRVSYIDAILARLLVNTFTDLIVMFVVIAGIIHFERLDVILDMPRILLAIAMALSLSIGVGLANCFLSSIFPVWERIWAIMNRPIFILSCLFFTFESVPAGIGEWLWYNPLVHVVGVMRSGIFVTYEASYAAPLYVFGLSMGLSIFGLVMLNRYKSYILNEL